LILYSANEWDFFALIDTAAAFAIIKPVWALARRSDVSGRRPDTFSKLFHRGGLFLWLF